MSALVALALLGCCPEVEQPEDADAADPALADDEAVESSNASPEEAPSAKAQEGVPHTSDSRHPKKGADQVEALPEAPPERLTGAKQSSGSAPDWATGSDISAPQVDDLQGLFKDLRRERLDSDRLDKGVVVCRIHTTGNFDTFRGPDLSATVRIGDAGPVGLRGPEDKWTMHFSLPLVTLAKGNRIRISVIDRDAFGSDNVGSVSARFDGELPIYLDATSMDVECRAMGRERLEEEVTSNLDVLTRTLKRAPRTFKPNPKLRDWGYARTNLREVRGQLTSLAGLVGWADVRVTARVEQLGNLDTRWDTLARASVAKKHKGLPPAGTGTVSPDNALEFRVAEVQCSSKAARAHRPPFPHTDSVKGKCVLKLEVVNKGSEPVDCQPFFSSLGDVRTVLLVKPNGRMSQLALVTLEKDGYKGTENVSLDPGQQLTAAFRPMDDTPIDSGPQQDRARMIWLSSGREVGILRLD